MSKTMHSTNDKIGNWMTAREMAFLSHNLTDNGDTAIMATGTVWKWSNHFNVWSCVALDAVFA